MIKKYLAVAAITFSAVAGISIPATAGTVPGQEVTVVDSLPSGQVAVEGDWIPSKETNDVEESVVARKMTQAEKAQNAAENDSWGGAITIIAMCIVVFALVVLSLLFLGFGKISQILLTKKKREAKPVSVDSPAESHEDLDSGEVIAAIAAALSEHFGGSHDMEDTILTIRRMKRAYSPWNSKIYNLRHTPELSHHASGASALRHFNR